MRNVGPLHSDFMLIVFLFLYCIFQIAMYLTCTHTHTCRSSSTSDLIANDYNISNYDFEHPFNQDEEDGEEDCEIPRELARLLMK